MEIGVAVGVATLVGIVGLLFIGFQVRDRLETIATLLEKNK